MISGLLTRTATETTNQQDDAVGVEVEAAIVNVNVNGVETETETVIGNGNGNGNEKGTGIGTGIEMRTEEPSVNAVLTPDGIDVSVAAVEGEVEVLVSTVELTQTWRWLLPTNTRG